MAAVCCCSHSVRPQARHARPPPVEKPTRQAAAQCGADEAPPVDMKYSWLFTVSDLSLEARVAPTSGCGRALASLPKSPGDRLSGITMVQNRCLAASNKRKKARGVTSSVCRPTRLPPDQSNRSTASSLSSRRRHHHPVAKDPPLISARRPPGTSPPPTTPSRACA